MAKMKDYGSSWRILRTSSLTDQIFIKASRIRGIEEKGIQKIAEIYFDNLDIPEKARLDAAHIAIACYYKMDYFVTWNCAHIASAKTRRSLELLNRQLKLFTPIICTPEELMEV